MRFNIYGRFQLEVAREGDAWVAYRVGGGAQGTELQQDRDISIPAHLEPVEIAAYLEALFRELGKSGEAISLLN